MEKVTRDLVLLIITVAVLCTAKPLNPDIQKARQNPVNASANQNIWIRLSRGPDTDGERDGIYVADEETDNSEVPEYNADIVPAFIANSTIEISNITKSAFIDFLTASVTEQSDIPKVGDSVEIIAGSDNNKSFIATVGDSVYLFTDSDIDESDNDESDVLKLGDSVDFPADSDTDKLNITKLFDSVNFLANSDNYESNFTDVGDSVGFPTDSDTEESDNIGDIVDFLTDRDSAGIYIPETTTNPMHVFTDSKYTEYPLNVNKVQLSEKSDFPQTGIDQPEVLAESYPRVSEDAIRTTSAFNKIADEPETIETIVSTPVVLTTTPFPPVVHTTTPFPPVVHTTTPFPPVVHTESDTRELNVQTTTADEPDDENSLDFLTDPDVPKAIEATKKLNELINKYEQNMTREINDGFEFLNMTSRFQSSRGLKKNHLVKRVKRDLIPFIGDNGKLIDIMGTIVAYIEDEDEQHTEFLFSIISDVGSGRVNALLVYYKQREDGKYNFRQLKFSGKFKLSATLIITRIPESNSTTSETKDVISYLPREDATQKDVTGLMDIMVPRLGKLLFDFSPDTIFSKHNK